ncbi:MAG: RNA-binding protein [Candidatus Omnitrophota bacterium]
MKIYVGNLLYSTTGDDLRTTFEAFGQVESASVIQDKYSGRSKGFGFVEMSDKEQAQKAIDELNGKDMGGRSLNVNEARPRAEGRKPGSGEGNRQNRW